MRMVPGGRGCARAGQGLCPGRGQAGGSGADGIVLQEAPAERGQHRWLLQVAQGHQVMGTPEAAERRQLELSWGRAVSAGMVMELKES